jgi:hypothetical protein
LVVRAETGPLPTGTRINIRYGGNPEGEPYELGKPRTAQAVSCMEDLTPGGAPAEAPALVGGAGAGGAGVIATPTSDERVWALRCGLYTQGPARVDVDATGFEPVDDQALSFDDRRHCEVEREVTLVPLKPDAGTD